MLERQEVLKPLKPNSNFKTLLRESDGVPPPAPNRAVPYKRLGGTFPQNISKKPFRRVLVSF